MILFPEADADSLPTPCKPPFLPPPPSSPARLRTDNLHPVYEDEPSETRQPNGQSSKIEKASAEWFCSPSDYEQYLTRSLPPRVQRELERQIQREFGFFGDGNQTGRVVEMVQKLQLRLFKQFEQERKDGLTQEGSG